MTHTADSYTNLFRWLSLVLISLPSSYSPPSIIPPHSHFFSLDSELHYVALGVSDSFPAWQGNGMLTIQPPVTSKLSLLLFFVYVFACLFLVFTLVCSLSFMPNKRTTSLGIFAHIWDSLTIWKRKRSKQTPQVEAESCVKGTTATTHSMTRAACLTGGANRQLAYLLRTGH